MIFRIHHSYDHHKTRKPIFTVFECDALSLDDLIGRLNKGEVVKGDRLITHGDGTGFKIVDRSPFAIAAGGVGSIEVPRSEFRA